MKIKWKILLVLFISITTILNIGKVFGVGILNYSWIIEEGNTRKLLFREFTSPHASTVESYDPDKYGTGTPIGTFNFNGSYDGKSVKRSGNSRWIYSSGSYARSATAATFKTVGFAFHTKQIGSYNKSGSGYGYAVTGEGRGIDASVENLNATINAAYKQAISKPDSLMNGYNNSLITDNNYFFFRVFNTKYVEQNASELNSASSPFTRRMAKNLTAGDYDTAHRYAILTTSQGHTIIITDWVLYQHDLEELVEKAAGQGIGSGGRVYISSILITRPWSSASYFELLKTGASFFYAWNGPGAYKNWGTGTRGSDAGEPKALGSVLNLYDNIFVLPVTDYRTIYVRHINIDTDEVINTSIVNNAKRIKNSNPTILVEGASQSGTPVVSKDPYAGNNSDYYDYFEKKAEVGKAVSVAPLNTNVDRALSDGSTLIKNGYRLLGYNIGQSTKLIDAVDNLEVQIKQGNMKSVSGGKVNISKSDKKDYVVVDFYYNTYDGDVEVNHVLLDNSNNALSSDKQVLDSNDTAVLSNNKTINNLYKDSNSSYYNKNKINSEIYRLPLNTTITTRKVAEIKHLKIKHEYVGYDLNSPSSSINPAMLSKAESVAVSPNKKVTFYYRVKMTDIIVSPPEKDISGKLSWDAMGSDKLSTSCQDDNELVESIPSGGKIRLGVTDISRFMVGAITSEYVELPNQVLTTKFTIRRGTQSKTYDYAVKYYPRYFIITDLLVYKLNNIDVYNTEAGFDGTRGEKLFNWSNGKANISPTGNMNARSLFELFGLQGKISTNNIRNINNYVSSSIYDKSNNRQDGGSNSATYSKTLLTTDQIREVDANENGIINNDDKVFATARLATLRTTLTATELELNTRKTAYQKALADLETLETAYNVIETEWKRLKTEYEKETATTINLFNSYNNAILKYNSDNAAYVAAQEQNTDYLNIYNEAIDDLQDYEDALTSSNETLTNLHEAYIENTTELNRLESLIVDCDDINITHAQNVKNYDEYLKGTYKDVSEELERLKTIWENCDEENEDCSDYETAYNTYLNGTYKDTVNEIERLEGIKNNSAAQAQTCTENTLAYETYRDETYKDSQDAYESYRDNDNFNAINNRNNYRDGEFKEAKDNYINHTNTILIPALNAKNSSQRDKNTAYDLYKTHYDDYYLPAKNAYESYTENPYQPKKGEYEAFRDITVPAKFKLYNDYNNNEYRKARNEYNSYLAYKNNLDVKYPTYKQLYDDYDEYLGYTPSQIANEFGLKADIKVQNMQVNLKDIDNNKSSTIISTKTKIETISLSNIPATPVFVEAEGGILGDNENEELVKKIYGSIDESPLTLNHYTNNFEIPRASLNGVRALSAEATYIAEIAIGDNTSYITDNTYYKVNTQSNTQDVFNIRTGSKLQKVYKEKDATGENSGEVELLNVYTPISVSAEIDTDKNKIVNQSNIEVGTGDNKQVVQQNVPFIIKFSNQGVGSQQYKLINTSKFNAGYYIKFDFDVINVSVNGKLYNNGKRVAAGTWIGMIEGTNAQLSAQAYTNTQVQYVDNISEENSSYTVRAVAYNATSRMRLSSIDFAKLAEMKDNKKDTNENIINICSEISYFAQEEYNIVLLNRMYDFKITDIKDVNWKNVFRKSTGTSTNIHTGTAYYSGNARWDTESDKINSLISRTASEIGRSPLRILPLGPYKNTNTSYINAPKLGYRFSFDLKVTGSYYKSELEANNRPIPRGKKIEITPSFYYVSKNGETYLKTYDGSSEGIYLFYKNSNGKYVRVGSGDDNYKLSITPNDGYRYIKDKNTTTLSTKPIEMGTLSKITLNHEMATMVENGSLITYYGEYKLPNSTIAVRVDKNGKYDLNNPLSNGYIGIIFNIDAIENEQVSLSYLKNTNGQNTSQWDYEGYLGARYGKPLINTIIQLEKGKWTLDDTMYNNIKGTVLLYDLDSRAATDYE